MLALAVSGQPPAETLHYMPTGAPHVVGPDPQPAAAAEAQGQPEAGQPLGA